jgi:hypothetical protein
MTRDPTRRVLQAGVDPADPVGSLIALLEAAVELVSLPGNDFGWSSWTDAVGARAELEGLIAAMRRGARPPCAPLFAPTGPLQEVAVSSGWGEDFLALAERFDEVEARLGRAPEPAPTEGPEGASGCRVCWPPSAEAAWAARGALERRARLIDESHVDVSLLRCPDCGQDYLSVWTEQIDWAGGEDPQSSTLLPLTPAEAAGLAAGGPPDEDALEAFGSGRRSLRREHPSDGAPRLFWGRGLRVGRHD